MMTKTLWLHATRLFKPPGCFPAGNGRGAYVGGFGSVKPSGFALGAPKASPRDVSVMTGSRDA